MNSTAKRAVILAATLVLAGCGGGVPKSAGSVAPAANKATDAHRWPGRVDVGKAILLLDQGKPKPARKLLAKVLKRQPNDAVAARLAKQIDEDPVALLGAENFRYVVGERESFAMVAQRFLGDPNLFYALARYNDAAVPAHLTPGTVLRVPGREKRDIVPPQPRPQPQPAAKVPREANAAPVKPAAPPAAPPPLPVTARDTGRAAKLRAAGLEQMNRGAIGRAVILLTQASRLDPANPLIRRDLARAQRIQRTVRSTQ